jgi:hypothetical protein
LTLLVNSATVSLKGLDPRSRQVRGGIRENNDSFAGLFVLSRFHGSPVTREIFPIFGSGWPFHIGQPLAVRSTMSYLEVPVTLPPTCRDAAEHLAERAESELRRNGYVALKNIACEYRDGVLVLNGCLPTYYLKQVAQEAVAHLAGIEHVENRIEVLSVSQRSAYRM